MASAVGDELIKARMQGVGGQPTVFIDGKTQATSGLKTFWRYIY
jgi:hypothetical protein